MDEPDQLGAIPVQTEGEQLLPGDAAELTTPSGLVVRLQDVVWNAPGPEGLTLRFRFVAPAIAGVEDEDSLMAASEDMLWLCQTYALPRLPATGPKPSQIVISLADRDLPFGEAAPDATQFFEAYTVTPEGCEWSVF
jgi:Family of unknown function (DUF6497)